MAFNITSFRSAMAFDGSRANLFEVTLTNVEAGAAFNGTDLKLFAKGTSIPGATIGTVIVPYFGREIKLAGNRTFPEWTITVLNDENFTIRSQFEKWMDGINSHGGNTRGTQASGTPSLSYTSTGTVNQFSKGGGTATASYSFINLFPTDLSEITLDWGDNDTIEEYTVTFAYDYWIRTATSEGIGKGTGATAILQGTSST
jgi:hypothetical protein